MFPRNYLKYSRKTKLFKFPVLNKKTKRSLVKDKKKYNKIIIIKTYLLKSKENHIKYSFRQSTKNTIRLNEIWAIFVKEKKNRKRCQIIKIIWRHNNSNSLLFCFILLEKIRAQNTKFSTKVLIFLSEKKQRKLMIWVCLNEKEDIILLCIVYINGNTT